MRNTVEHLTQLEWMWEEFLLKGGLLATTILVRVRIFCRRMHVSRTYKCVQSHRSVCFQELITTDFVTSLERSNFISCLSWKSEIVVLHGGPACARKSGVISHPDGHSSYFVWLSWFSSIHFHRIKKMWWVIRTVLKFVERVFVNSLRIQACMCCKEATCWFPTA